MAVYGLTDDEEMTGSLPVLCSGATQWHEWKSKRKTSGAMGIKNTVIKLIVRVSALGSPNLVLQFCTFFSKICLGLQEGNSIVALQKKMAH